MLPHLCFHHSLIRKACNATLGEQFTERSKNDRKGRILCGARNLRMKIDLRLAKVPVNRNHF